MRKRCIIVIIVYVTVTQISFRYFQSCYWAADWPTMPPCWHRLTISTTSSSLHSCSRSLGAVWPSSPLQLRIWDRVLGLSHNSSMVVRMMQCTHRGVDCWKENIASSALYIWAHSNFPTVEQVKEITYLMPYRHWKHKNAMTGNQSTTYTEQIQQKRKSLFSQKIIFCGVAADNTWPMIKKKTTVSRQAFMGSRKSPLSPSWAPPWRKLIIYSFRWKYNLRKLLLLWIWIFYGKWK